MVKRLMRAAFGPVQRQSIYQRKSDFITVPIPGGIPILKMIPLVSVSQYCPRDRFAAIEPTDAIAQVTLKSIELSNVNRITINADATDGDVRVELLTAGGYRVAGYTRDQSVIITGNSLRHPVNWKRKTMADLAAGRYQLRLHLKNARLFALTIQR